MTRAPNAHIYMHCKRQARQDAYLVLLAGDFARRFVLPGDFARRFVGVFSEAGTARLLAGSWLEVPF